MVNGMGCVTRRLADRRKNSARRTDGERRGRLKSEIALAQQQVEDRPHSLGANHIHEDEELRDLVRDGEATYHEPDGEQVRKAHLDRSTRRVDADDRSEVRQEGADDSSLPGGGQEVFTTSNSKFSTCPPRGSNVVADGHGGARALVRGVDVLGWVLVPCHKQEPSSSTRRGGEASHVWVQAVWEHL